MLSYRHAFHAGNHADVLKHFVLSEVLAYYSGKGKPYWIIDTHAGAGLYALDRGYATQNKEYLGGIGALWKRDDLPPPLARYVDQVRACNPDGTLRFYPGSPQLARQTLQPADRLRLFELHPGDVEILLENFDGLGRQVRIEKLDGYAGLKALLPPPTRRGVILIDPPYEEKQDYARVVDALKDSLQRFATGTYLLWYPLLQRPEPRLLQERLGKLGLASWLHVALRVRTPSAEGPGMSGSGMFVINPPWILPEKLQQTLPYLVDRLGQDDGAGFSLDFEIA